MTKQLQAEIEQLQAECKEWERIYDELENEYWIAKRPILPDPSGHGKITIDKEAYDKVMED